MLEKLAPSLTVVGLTALAVESAHREIQSTARYLNKYL